MQLPSLYIDTIQIKDAHIKIDSDSADITGELLGIYPLSPFFQGQAKVHNFSLPRWIGSTRKMSGGLVKALNNIRGDLDFVVNKRGVFSPSFLGQVNEIFVEGLGSCAYFKKPDIALKIKPSLKNLNKNTVNLNSLFPEINGIDINKIQLPPAAVPARNKKDTSHSIFVDYHIDIAIPEADIWKLSAKDIHTMISPDKNETPTINVLIGDLYKGKANAFAILNDGNNFIKATVQHIDLEEPVRNVTGFTAVRGILNTTAEIQLAGNSIEKILSSLQVKAMGKIENGSFHSINSLIHSFKNVTYNIDTKSIPFYMQNVKLPDYFQMKGNYKISMQDTNLDTEVITNAILDFSSKNGLPLRMSPQTSTIKYYANGTTELERFFVKGKGLLGYDFTKDEYLNLKDFNGTYNGNIVSGSYNIHEKEQLDWSGKIHFDQINLDEYFFSKESTLPKSNNEPSSFLPMHFLSHNSMNYALSAKKAILLGTTIQNMSSEITLNNGKMAIKKTMGTIEGGGNIQAFLEAKVTDNLPSKKGHIQSKMKFQIDNANMLAISKMREHDTLIAGNALFQLTVHGTFQTFADILSKLNGTWNVNIQNGYIQNNKPESFTPTEKKTLFHASTVTPPQGKNKNGSKTYFNNLLASGNIINSLVSTPKFVVSSSTLSVIGDGTFNIVNKQINAKAKATYHGISEIPITVTGTIDNPITSIHFLNAVAGTLGNIGSGIFGILGSVLTAPFQLFIPEKVLPTP